MKFHRAYPEAASAVFPCTYFPFIKHFYVSDDLKYACFQLKVNVPGLSARWWLIDLEKKKPFYMIIPTQGVYGTPDQDSHSGVYKAYNTNRTSILVTDPDDTSRMICLGNPRHYYSDTPGNTLVTHGEIGELSQKQTKNTDIGEFFEPEDMPSCVIPARDTRTDLGICCIDSEPISVRSILDGSAFSKTLTVTLNGHTGSDIKLLSPLFKNTSGVYVCDSRAGTYHEVGDYSDTKTIESSSFPCGGLHQDNFNLITITGLSGRIVEKSIALYKNAIKKFCILEQGMSGGPDPICMYDFPTIQTLENLVSYILRYGDRFTAEESIWSSSQTSLLTSSIDTYINALNTEYNTDYNPQDYYQEYTDFPPIFITHLDDEKVLNIIDVVDGILDSYKFIRSIGDISGRFGGDLVEQYVNKFYFYGANLSSVPAITENTTQISYTTLACDSGSIVETAYTENMFNCKSEHGQTYWYAVVHEDQQSSIPFTVTSEPSTYTCSGTEYTVYEVIAHKDMTVCKVSPYNVFEEYADFTNLRIFNIPGVKIHIRIRNRDAGTNRVVVDTVKNDLYCPINEKLEDGETIWGWRVEI